jgi:hypothetical protein
VPGTAAGWSVTLHPAKEGARGWQNTPYTTYDLWNGVSLGALRVLMIDADALRRVFGEHHEIR